MIIQQADKKTTMPNIAAVACGVLLSACLSGCAGLAQQQDNLAELQNSVERLQTEMAQTRTAVMEAEQTSTQHNDALSADLAGLNQKLTALDGVITETCKTVAVPVPAAQPADCPDPVEPVVLSQGDKLVLGEIEHVTVVEPEFQVVARMDTGASSSSLHATNLVEFERDGDEWVRFEVKARDSDSESVNIEKPVKKFVRVFQQADKEGSRRPVVELRISLGNVQGVFEFTLADRSHLAHGMILGRNFLTDIAVVDVSRQFIQPANATRG